MASRVKVLDVFDGFHLECIKICKKAGESEPVNPYRLYITYNGRTKNGLFYSKHRKQIAAYGDLISVLCFIKDLYLNGIDCQPINYVISWSREYHNSRI